MSGELGADLDGEALVVDGVDIEYVEPDVGKVEAEPGGEDEPQPPTEVPAATYCFSAGEEPVVELVFRDGEEIVPPEDPTAPEGKVFAGWFLEDGTPLFAGEDHTAHVDPLCPFINVYARFDEIVAQVEASVTPEDGATDGAETPEDAADSDPVDTLVDEHEDVIIGDEPAGDEPAAEEPAEEEPAEEEPAEEESAEEVPAEEEPAEEVPAEEEPAEEEPAEEESAEEVPAEEEPAEEVPAEEEPAEEEPAEEEPAEEEPAVEEPAEGEPTVEVPAVEVLAAEALAEGDPAEESAAEAPAVKPLPFDQCAELYGVNVRVQADAGVFPNDAVLSVTRVRLYGQRQVDAAVEDARDEGQNVAASYTFDIKVIDPATGNEYQPAEDQAVNVSFSLAEAADGNLEPSVYHIEEAGGEMTAEKLDTDVTAETVTAVSEGFSIYTVEFTYGDLQYVLTGGDSVPLSEVLSTLGLTGAVSGAATSAPGLFSVSPDENGVWMVYSHRVFSSEEWMTVVIDGIEYRIAVTDDQMVNYLKSDGSAASKTCTIIDSSNIPMEWNASWYAVTESVTIEERVTVSGTVNLILCDGTGIEDINTLTAEKGITVAKGNTLNIYVGKKGAASSASDITGNGALIAGGADTPNYYAGIGGANDDAGGTVNIIGGHVTVTGGQYGAGIGTGSASKGTGGSITISGGEVTANGGGGGAGIGAGVDSTQADIALSYSATNGSVPALPKILSSSYVGAVTMSGDFCEWLGENAWGVVFEAANANVDQYKEAMAGLTIVPCPAGTHRIDVELLPGYGSGTPKNRAFAVMQTGTGTEIPVVKAVAGSSIALRGEAAQGCEIEYRPSRLTGSNGQEIQLDRNDTFTMPDCDASAYLTQWAWLQWAIDRAANAEGGASITLPADITAENWEKALAVPNGQPVTVDLAGHSIDRNLNSAEESDGVIDVTGGLTVKDDNQSKTDKITGGYTVGNGGGVYVHGGGALALTGGAVTGNRAAHGGGMYVADGSPACPARQTSPAIPATARRTTSASPAARSSTWRAGSKAARPSA